MTDDGTETDLDLGHYERFTDEKPEQILQSDYRQGLLECAEQRAPGCLPGPDCPDHPPHHQRDRSCIYNLAKSTEADVVITEIGGTTGDIESQPFLEAIRQVGIEQGPENCCYIHVVLVPYISGSDEYKSKPAQHSCKELQGMGIAPNVIVLRADGPVGSDIKRKISMFCNVRPDCVIENLTMPSLYECPLMLEAAGLTNVVARQLHLQTPPTDLTEWKELISRIATRSRNCKIALVGKYVKLHDAYLSVMESLYHAGSRTRARSRSSGWTARLWVDQDRCARRICRCGRHHIVPGGFGDRGIEGMIQAAQYARENCMPYFGICLGMQIAVMEYARNVLGYTDANSSEFAPEGQHNVIDLMPTSRAWKRAARCAWASTLHHHPGTKMAECYGTLEIDERHRHRYEFNNDFRAEFEEKGLVIAGTSPDGRLVEAVEIPGRDFHLGAQFTPSSRAARNRAHPLSGVSLPLPEVPERAYPHRPSGFRLGNKHNL